MWVTFGVILVALVMYAIERIPEEVTSIVVICLLMVFFSVFPVAGTDSKNLLPPERLLAGFANPALLGPWSDDGDVVILCKGFRERLEKWRIDSVVVGN